MISGKCILGIWCKVLIEIYRTTLVANMLSYVEFYEPRYVLMENVKGLLQHHSQGYGLDEDDEDGDKIIKMVIVKFVLRALTCLGYADSHSCFCSAKVSQGIKLNSGCFKVSNMNFSG